MLATHRVCVCVFKLEFTVYTSVVYRFLEGLRFTVERLR